MCKLNISAGSLIGNKGNVTLKFSSKEEKKAYVKAYLKEAKEPLVNGTEPLKAVIAEQQFESELEAWAIEQGYVLAEDKPVHYEPLRFIAHSATKPAKVKRLAEFMTKEEWNCKVLSSNTMRRLGLKGSPKLSKVLVSLGVPNRKVELMLGGSVKSIQSSNVSYVTNEGDCIKDQGNSIYYSSCQANDSRAKWSGDDSYSKVDQDLEADGLFLWCIGEPMHIDGKGFIARAKLRLLTDSNDYVCGLYIDRPYGAHQLLMDNVQELVDWWSTYCKEEGYGNQPIFVAPSWQREDGEGANFEHRFGGISKSMYCDSANYGYQDTMTQGSGPYSFFKSLGVESDSWLKRAYLVRPKQDNVYLCSLKDVDYNSQKGTFVNPKITNRTWRGWISNGQRELAYMLIKYLGKADSRFEFDCNEHEVTTKYKNKSIKAYKGLHKVQLNYNHTTVVDICLGKIEVYNTLEELGFYKPEQLPYSYSNNTLTIDRTEYGFVRAVSADIPINKQGKVTVNRDGFSYPVALPSIEKGVVYIPSDWSNQHQYIPSSKSADNNLSLFPWASALELPYNIKDDTLTVTKDIKGYYAQAVSLNNNPLLRMDEGLKVISSSYKEFGYAQAQSISYGNTYIECYWRQGYEFERGGSYSYNVRIVQVDWAEEGYMSPCNLEDAPIKRASSSQSNWEEIYDIEDDVYGDRVLNRLPDPYFSEEDSDVINQGTYLFD